MDFFSVEYTVFTVLDYPVSLIELVGTLFGLLSVIFASRTNILTWSTGIVNEFCLFLLFFQIQLYPDMFLQVFFFGATIFGWYQWRKPQKELRISFSDRKQWMIYLALIAGLTIVSGAFFAEIHQLLPSFFKEKAALPYLDSFVMVSSVVATILLAKKRIETWYLWIAVDITCTFLYMYRGVYFLAIEYAVFLGIATYGLSNWLKMHRND